jgi:hypothetical protein
MSFTNPNIGPQPTSSFAYDPVLANSNPQMYAATLAGQPAPEDMATLNALQKLMQYDLELNRERNLNSAKDRYGKLDKDIQYGLQFLNPDADYMQPKQNYLQQVGSGIVSTFKAPFRTALNVAQESLRPIQTQVSMYLNATAQKSPKEAFEFLTTKKNWSDAWDGHNQWNPDVNDKLTNKHGRALSALVKGQIDGKKPGDIIREWGNVDAEMMDAIRSMADYHQYVYNKASNKNENFVMSDEAKAYSAAAGDFSSQQQSPGRDYANWVNKNHPPKKGLLGAFLLSPLDPSLAEPSKDGKKWITSNLNPFSPENTTDFSGNWDALWSLTTDPLTWLTAGSSRAITEGAKLAETYVAAGKAGIPLATRVSDIFTNPRFVAKHENLVTDINELRVARQAGDDGTAGAVYLRIMNNHPEYADENILNALLTTKVYNGTEELVNVTDMRTLESFFNKGEYANFIISGRTHNIGYYRENHVALERAERLTTDKVRKTYEKVFNGVDSTAANGIADGTSIAARAASVNKVFAKRIEPGVLNDPETELVLKELTQHGTNLTRGYSKFMAIHPENVQLFTSPENVHKSMDAFRDFTRVLVGDKLTANVIAERFLRVDPEDRTNMLYSLFKLYTDKIGMSATSEGLVRQRAFLDGLFGDKFGLGTVANVKTPKHLAKDNVIEINPGASQPFHGTDGVSMPRFEEIHQELYETIPRGPMRFLRGFSYDKSANFVGQVWTALQLFPKIGFKAAADEATLALFTAAPQAIAAFLSGKGAAVSNIVAAYSGSEKSIGVVKALLLGKRNPAKYVPAREREAMQEIVKEEVSYTMKNGKEVTRFEFVPADEYHGAPYADRLANKVIARYGGKLNPEEKQWIHTFLINNGHAMEGAVQSSVAASFGNTMVKGSLAAEIYGKNDFAKFLDARNLEQMPKFATIESKKLSEASLTEIHYDAFWRYFGRNKWSFGPTKTVVDFGDIFIRHNALRTAKDGEAYFNEIMGKIGFKRNDMGSWEFKRIPVKDKDGNITLSTELAEKSVNAFFSNFRQTADLALQGKTPAEIAEGLIVKSRDELYTIFHGSDEAFNENLLQMVKFKIDEAVKKVESRQDFRKSEGFMREYLKQPNKWDTKAVKKARSEYEALQRSASYHISKTPYVEFEDVTQGFRLKGDTVRTNLNVTGSEHEFKLLGVTVDGVFKKFGRFVWEMMDRQINDLYRADAFAVKLLEQRTKLKPDQQKIINDLVLDKKKAEGKDFDATRAFEDARIQADIMINNRATDNAINELMKYADNPNVRTQMAWNLRSVGRFNRAGEDFYRRMYRVGRDRGIDFIYRGSHLGQAMDASGAVYKDQQGNEYVMIPNDGLLFRIVAPAFAAVMNPLHTVSELYKGVNSFAAGDKEKAMSHFKFFMQPEWNQYTAKISMLNPSYSDSAGVFSLQGPTMAITVLGARELFNISGKEKIGEQLDNLLLGPISDNTTWARALVPAAVTNQLLQLDPDHEIGIYATSVMQAAAFLQAHDQTRLNPEDYGNIDKTQKYYDRLGIAAYNVIAAKAGFNTWSAIPVGLSEIGITPEMRRAGLVTFNQEYVDILRAVYEVNALYGYQNVDPIAVATSAFIGSYPDRAIFTVSKNSKAAKTYIGYTQETKNWVLDNKKMITKYGNVAYAFAPHTGEYDPAVAKVFQMWNWIPDADNPFVNLEGPQTSPLYRYIKDVAAARARMEYYDLDRNLQKDLTDPNNPLRNDPVYQADMNRKTADRKAQMLAGNPLLKYMLGTSEFETRQSLISRFKALDQLVNDPSFVSTSDPKKKPKGDTGKLPEGQRGLVQFMTKQVNKMLEVFEDTNIRSQYDGQLTLDKVYEDGINELKKLSVGQPAASEAYRSIILPLLEDVYRIPTKGIK